MFISLRKKYATNPCISYLNINSLRGNKFDSIKQLCDFAAPDVFCIDETKLSDDFPDAQFYMQGFQHPPLRRDRCAQKNKTQFGGGKIVYVKEGFIYKRLTKLETPTAETICIEITVNSRKWFIMFSYRPESIDRKLFFEETLASLEAATKVYENILLAGDLNVNFQAPKTDVKSYLSEMCDLYNLKNLINVNTCMMSTKGSSLDVLLTNRPKLFKKTSVIETGISDHHKMVLTFLKSHFQKLPPKVISYRSLRKVNETAFIADVNNINYNEIYSNSEPFDILTKTFKAVVDKHAPLKNKIIRGNQKPYMCKKLAKAIMTRSRIRNRYNKYKSRENFIALQKAKSTCKQLSTDSKKEFYNKATENGNMTSKSFWELTKPMITNKCKTSGNTIKLEENGKIIDNDEEIANIFNKHYVNIVENCTGKAPTSVSNDNSKTSDRENVDKIISKYKTHPSVKKIKECICLESMEFQIPAAKKDHINKIIKNIDVTKATGPDQIPPKLVKIAADMLAEPLTYIINNDIKRCMFSENAKTANVTPLYKSKYRLNKINYRPLTVCSVFSKIYERYLQEVLTPYINKVLSIFISAYRKHYSSSHVLMKLIEQWKKNLDSKKFVGAILMDLSKAFDCIPHDLLIAKMHAYGFTLDTLVFFYSYLKRRKQRVKINNAFSSFLTLISGVPQGSILGPILFNIFINDLFLWMKEAELNNFADDQTICGSSDSIPDLIKILERESDVIINWFNQNNMIINPEKSNAIIINKNGRYNETHNIRIDGQYIESEKDVNLLGLNIDYKLNFKRHISNLCKRAAARLNAINRLAYSGILNTNSKKVLIESFVQSQFNYCPLIWHFCSNESTKKMEKIQERALRLLLNDKSSSYEELLVNGKKTTLHSMRIRNIKIEIFKTLNNLNPVYMKDIFVKNTRSESTKLYVQRHNAKTYGEKSLRILGPKIWNELSEHIRSEKCFQKFKSLISE